MYRDTIQILDCLQKYLQMESYSQLTDYEASNVNDKFRKQYLLTFLYFLTTFEQHLNVHHQLFFLQLCVKTY